MYNVLVRKSEGKRTRIRVGEAGDNIKMDIKYGGVCEVNEFDRVCVPVMGALNTTMKLLFT
jgi:hypothetical protein